ncbi:MAG: hypothetical protein DRJ56_05615 [Thermoprotei archaeon]|nr:MAG: hypothetical protein DRJ56_05615 [Thermoprotei archaeon]
MVAVRLNSRARRKRFRELLRIFDHPSIDEFSREAVVFERAYAEGLPTLPVRTALFTGRYTIMTRCWQHLVR